jgi:hypothetical protein
MSTHRLRVGTVLSLLLVAACVGDDPEAANASSSGTSGSSSGSSGSSSGSSGVTNPTAPLAPTNALATANVAKGATVTWAAPSSNGGQPITEYTITSNPGDLVAKASADKTSTVFTGLTLGTSYTFAVTATNGIGTSPAATTNSVTVVDQPSPVLDSGCPGEKGFVPFFGPVAGADSYNLYYGTAAGVTLANGTKIANVKNGAPALGNLAPGDYHVVITSVKAGVESLPSNELTISVAARAPFADTLFIARSLAISQGAIDVIPSGSTTTSSSSTKTIYGTNSGLNGLEQGIYADKATAMLYTHRSGGAGRIAIWHDAGGLADGDTPPTRVISGASTDLGTGSAIVVDSTRNILYATVNGAGPSEHRILVWKNACNVTGNVAPSATVKINTTSNFYLDLALDELHDRLYIASRSTSSTRVVFAVDGMSTKTGSIDATKTFTVQGVPTTNELSSVAYDATNDFLFIGSNVFNNGTVWRFNAPFGLAGPAISPAVSAGNVGWTLSAQHLATSGGALFVLLGSDPTNIPRWPSSTTLSSANPQGLPDKYMTTRTGLPGATLNYANGIAYVK